MVLHKSSLHKASGGGLELASSKFIPPPDESSPAHSTSIPWHPSLDAVVRCKPGEIHSRFPRCRCGQYAEKVTKAEVYGQPLEKLEEEGIFSIPKGHRQIFYTCYTCSSCPDGVRMTSRCRQGHDTMCDPKLQCINPNFIFDRGIKACRAPPHDENQLPVRGRANGPSSPANPQSTDESTSGTPLLIHTNQYTRMEVLAIIAIVVASLLLAAIFVSFAIIFEKGRRKRRTLHRNANSLSYTSVSSQTPDCTGCGVTETGV
ncbi:uncharacterized protein [Diadema setosum]|uniref:uncharacterized protein n=1 Tax=Diadema setosum TaxID=31175 RepID=UPI003B3A9345